MPAALLMTGAALLFASMGVCVKWASAQYSAGEVVFYRGLVGSLMLGEAIGHRQMFLGDTCACP